LLAASGSLAETPLFIYFVGGVSLIFFPFLVKKSLSALFKKVIEVIQRMRTKQFLKKGQERKTASILLREIIESLHQLFCCVPYFIAFVLFNSEEIIFPYLAGVLNIL
jgi:hypothetical protein